MYLQLRHGVKIDVLEWKGLKHNVSHEDVNDKLRRSLHERGERYVEVRRMWEVREICGGEDIWVVGQCEVR